ncbi:GGDEF domain-containing protein [Fundidesulfovibrio soli]|uniref:GGDEF domain-containing protein n=1 Tax=Fundidesulfovibrio soli TaxID=2922716 RepID=UPI001FAF8582|nr:GGDEF domain-containing protein [Fundidesulfovibrio soli]
MISHLAIGSYVFCLLLVIFQYGKPPAQTIPYLVTAKFLQGTGSLLLGELGPGPDYVTVMAANSLLLVGCAYEAWAVLHIVGYEAPRRLRLPVMAGIFAACAATWFLTPPVRTASVFLLHAVLYAIPAAALLRPGRAGSGLRRTLGAGFALLAALFLRLTALAAMPDEQGNPTFQTFMGMFVEPAVYCMMLASGFSLVLLSRERGDRELMLAQLRLQESNLKLAALNKTDWLTGIANRGYFEETLVKEYARHIRSGAPLSLLILDIDHFKEFNDRYGHPKGDECLRRIGEVLTACASRAGDLAARYGGEEFACILPATGAQGARAIAEEILQAIRDLAIPHGMSLSADRVTASIGLATAVCTKDGSPRELVALADSQLYKAKSSGRDHVESAEAGTA